MHENTLFFHIQEQHTGVLPLFNKKKVRLLLSDQFLFNSHAVNYSQLRLNSYINIPAATDTLRESICPCIGIDTIWSQIEATSRLIPSPSLPITMAVRSANFISEAFVPFISAPYTQKPFSLRISISLTRFTTVAIGTYRAAPEEIRNTVSFTLALLLLGTITNPQPN